MDEQDDKQSEPNVGQRAWSLSRLLGLILVVATVLVAIYVVIGYAAWQSGQSIRREKEAAQLDEQYARQVALAEKDIRQESFNLALRRLEWVLERDPSNPDAQAAMQQAQAVLSTELTPEILPTEIPLPEPSPTAGEQDEPANEIQRLRSLARQENWEDLLSNAIAFQRRFPNYERLETDGFLYDSYLNLGLDHIQGNQIELGIYYFTQAEKLGNLPQEAQDYWLWAELYLQGMAYFGVNWGIAADYFRDLCLSAPFYQGSCDKLFESLLANGNQYLAAQDYCPAVVRFREARQQNRTTILDDKMAQAVQGCAGATPTPAAITNTIPFPGTEPLDAPTVNE